MGMAKRGKEMRMKRNQKGFTIVELLIAVAILSIVIVTVCGFILVGSRSYAAGNSDINVQQEAQLALNQMSDLLIDTTRSVTYTGFDAGGTTSGTALKDGDFTFTPEDKSLVMLNGTAVKNPSGGPNPIIEEGNGNKNYHFYWDKSEETLFYAEADAKDPVPDFGDPAAEWVVLAGHVTDFSADLSQVAEKRVVMLALTFTDGTKEYVTSNNVTIRNKVGVNDAKLDPINKKKTLNIIPRDNPIVEPGETYHFSTPKVTGENVTDRSVTWSLATAGGNSPSHGTTFTDDQNGILQVATDEPAGVLDVVVTTNATDSDGNHASCTVPVHIKRVYPEGTGVVLAKTSDTDAENGANEISPGCTFTITATVSGYKLGEVCSVCGDDVTMDKQVSYAGNPYGNPYPWLIHDPSAVPGATTAWKPQEHIDIVDSGPDHATFYLHPDAPTSDDSVTYDVVIQAMSILSTQPNAASGRQYDTWVPGSIRLKMVKHDDEAEPYGGNLKYGEQTLDEKIREGLSTDHPKYATAIRVVDNTGKMPDRVLVYFTIGGGANYRICPDLFDLDLNGSYTFYMQAIDPVSKENRDKYNKHEIGSVIEDDAAAIKEEYFAHLDKKKPYGYIGDKYPHGKVFYAKLDRPKIALKMQGVEYPLGKGITCTPVNVYTTNRLIEKAAPYRYENIEGNAGMNGMVYSLYEGDGNVQSQWNKLYYYYYDEEKKEGSYRGSTSVGDGAASFNPGGDPFMQLNDQSKRLKVCGLYHIVPGMLYQNKAYKDYEIIGWQGFDYPNLPREVRYYEFDENTVHAEVVSGLNLELWSYYNDRFTKGKISFPMPSDNKSNEFNSYFGDISKNGKWVMWEENKEFEKLIDGTNDVTKFKPSVMRCRWVPEKEVYELELFYAYEDKKWNQKMYISAGTYYCKQNGKEWEQMTPGTYDAKFPSGVSETDMALVDVNTSSVSFDGCEGLLYIPLPFERSFRTTEGGGLGFWSVGQEKKYANVNLKYLPRGGSTIESRHFDQISCVYNEMSDEYTLTFENVSGNPSFVCKSNGSRWRQK